MFKVVSGFASACVPCMICAGIGAVVFLSWRRPLEPFEFSHGTRSQTVEFSEAITVRFVLRNRSSKQVEITAIEKNCDCATVGALPYIAQPFAEIEVPVNLNANLLKLPSTRQFYFHTNPPQPGLVGEVTVVPTTAQN